ncbi:MAG: aminoacyl-tRNA hydrolase [Myxococcota bacterium]|nr:aminoacyl-tRNA hydrolase [Myxococcota bacterium]
MKLLVGLGNPGPRYAATRHNVGFRVVERWAGRRGLQLEGDRFSGRFGRVRVEEADGGAGCEVGVLEPLTWMNRSGRAVDEALLELPVDPASDLVVVYDDVDLPFGRLRVRPAGSAGGHRGLADIVSTLGRSDLPRLRFGVGRPETAMDTADWVLEPFAPDEGERLPDLLNVAADAVEEILCAGVEAAMNRFNRAAASEAPEPVK